MTSFAARSFAVSTSAAATIRRARHADKAIEALQSGLRAHGLEGRVLQIATADHGELFGEGSKLEGEVQSFATGESCGAFASFDQGHGYACHERETDVPIVVQGPGRRTVPRVHSARSVTTGSTRAALRAGI
jgi:arylsulfatase A-like enzyme